MTTYEEVKDRQSTWANANGVMRSPDGRAVNLDDNLMPPLTQDARAEFSKGRGNELAGKMKALHSSSALVYNIFEHWRNKALGQLAQALTTKCFIPREISSMELEREYPTGLLGVSPHLDVVLHGSDGWAVAIESKFTEPYRDKAIKPGSITFQESYIPKEPGEPGIWAMRGLPQCEFIARSIQNTTLPFSYLDAPQLLKHILGLKKHFESNFTLLYLWYEWESAEAAQHRAEIDIFTQNLKGEVSFCSMTYNELYIAMKGIQGIDPVYLSYLFERYFDIP